MKIGFFTDSYKPYTSGVVTSISTFKEELIKLGHEVHIFAPNYPNYQEKEKNVYRFFSLPSPTNTDYTLALPFYLGMNMLMKKLNLDIIHVHSPFTMGRVGMHYARKYHLPLIFTYHTLYDQYVHYVPVAQDIAREVTIKYSKNFCNQCDHLIAPSNDLAEVLINYEIKTTVSVIPTGVPINKFIRDKKGDFLRDKYKIPKDNKILLFVGRLTKEKNLEFLIKAYRKIKNKMPDTTLVLTAQGPLEKDLKKLSQKLELILDKDIIFTGALEFETLVEVYYSADLFVFSSLTETQGLVLIEAMAAGLPVVAIKAHGVKDMVDHEVNGLLTSEDKDEFCEAVCRLLNNEALFQKFKIAALEKAQDLSSFNMVKKLEHVYEEQLMTQRKHHRRLLDVSSWFNF